MTTARRTRPAAHIAAVALTAALFAALPAPANAQEEDPALSVSNITKTSATLNLANHDDLWYYEQIAPTSGTCSAEIAAGTSTAALTGLTAGTVYAYRAHEVDEDSPCTDDSEIAVVTFTTPGVVLSDSKIIAPEQGSATYTVRLGSAPTANVTVRLTKTGDGDLATDTNAATSGNQRTLTFTTANWNTAQSVTVTARNDTDTRYGSATVTHTATSSDSVYDNTTKSLSLAEGDNDVCQNTSAVSGAASGTLVDDCNTLLAAKATLAGTSTGLNWSTGTAIADWADVSTANNRITRIEAWGRGLNGSMPNILGNLTGLTDVDLSVNSLTGTIPLQFGDLTNLTQLELAGNSLTGCVPPNLVGFAVAGSINTQGNDVSLTACDGVAVSDARVTVKASATATYTVRLATKPSAQVTVTLSLQGDRDITADTDTSTAGNQAGLTFGVSNWATPQTVTLSAVQDNDDVSGTTKITHTTASSDSGYSSLTATVTAVEFDDKPVLFAEAVTEDSATLKLIRHTGNWWLKRTSPAAGDCKPKNKTYTENLTRLDTDTTYTYKAYSNSSCTTQIGSTSFTTPSTPTPGNGSDNGPGTSPGNGSDPAPDPDNPFTDDNGSVFEDSINKVAAAGITKGCNTAGTRFCPNQPVTRAQMAVFLQRALKLPAPSGTSKFTDSAGFAQAAIDAMAAAGITLGCNAEGTLFCPNQPVTRGQMAAFLARALKLPTPTVPAAFDDTTGSIFNNAIAAILKAGITKGCDTAGTRFCPNQPVTRGQMATFLARALDL